MHSYRGDPWLAVFTSTQVVDDGMPVLRAVHDHDGDWQFLSGHEYGESEDIRIVALPQVVDADSTLEDILWLEPGMQAQRSDLTTDWVISVFALES